MTSTGWPAEVRIFHPGWPAEVAARVASPSLSTLGEPFRLPGGRAETGPGWPAEVKVLPAGLPPRGRGAPKSKPVKFV
jgi:hypothetical protein